MLAQAIAGLVLAGIPINVAHWPSEASRLGPPLEDQTPVHLSVIVRGRDPAGLADFLQKVQEPHSSIYRHFLTPKEFGERFGEGAEEYSRDAAWLRGAGFQVATVPGQLTLGATGTQAQLRTLLGVELRSAAQRDGQPKVTIAGTPRAPKDVAGHILLIEGLDSEATWRPNLALVNATVMGPQDLRRFYGVQALLDQGITGRGTHLAVLLASSPNEAAPQEVVQDFFNQISNTSATYVRRLLPNPTGSVPKEGGTYTESVIDVEMLSVNAPGAATITLVVPPYNEVFSGGISDIVNNLPDTTAVSISFGTCEGTLQRVFPDLANGVVALRTLLQQGLAEGITWFAASGDFGSDQCGVDMGTSTGLASVEFPSSLPEVVAVGGTQFNATFDAKSGVTGYQSESVWNDQYGAAGGGASSLFPKPSWQIGLTPDDGVRDSPDVSLLAGAPYVVFEPFAGTPFYSLGTSFSSPLVAGIFALIADATGCRLGDIHPMLYALGAAQLDGGAAVFHDITQGNNSYLGAAGYTAALGFDLATGWGSIDAAALAAVWPACPGADAGPRSPWDPCSAIGCGPSACQAVAEGPSQCVLPCGAGCAPGQICDPLAVSGVQGCMPGCTSDRDCAAGSHCFTCGGFCELTTPGAQVGDPCQGDSDCGLGQRCRGPGSGAPNGFCTSDCDGCTGACPTGSACDMRDRCVPRCTGAGSCRPGYGCFLLNNFGDVGCYPGCSTTPDCAWAPGTTCLADRTGCVYPDGGRAVVPPLDGGPVTDDAGTLDAGSADGGPLLTEDAGSPGVDGGTTTKSTAAGCGCTTTGGNGWAFVLLTAMALTFRRRIWLAA